MMIGDSGLLFWGHHVDQNKFDTSTKSKRAYRAFFKPNEKSEKKQHPACKNNCRSRIVQTGRTRCWTGDWRDETDVTKLSTDRLTKTSSRSDGPVAHK